MKLLVPQKKNSFLQQFIELSETGQHLTDTEILDEVIVIMIGVSLQYNCLHEKLSFISPRVVKQRRQ